MIKDKKILIRKPFREQYTLIIDSKVNAIESSIFSTIELRYDFQVLKIEKEFIEIRLLVLDNKIIEANNPMVKEIAQVSQVFGRMYNELHLKISENGTVLEVLNNDFILSKWNETKKEMEKYIAINPDLQQAISLNDTLFNTPEQVKKAIQANEFFSVYFGHIYNVDLPNRKKVFGTNIFNTANLEWDVESESNAKLPSENLETVTILTNAKPEFPLSLGSFNAAYHQFKDKINIDPAKVKIFQQEEHIIDYKTGKLKKASVEKVEDVVSEKLYHKFKFTMTSDSEKKKTNHEKIDSTPENEIYKDENGKEYTHEEWIEHKQKFWGTGSIE